MYKQIFISHSWGKRRSTHQFAIDMYSEIIKLGWTCWLDEFDMGNDLDTAMTEGIYECDIAMILITEDYCEKIQMGQKYNNNCYKEWTYINSIKKKCIPIVLDKDLCDQTLWPKVMRMYLTNRMYIYYTGDLVQLKNEINKKLLMEGLKPCKKLISKSLDSSPELEPIKERKRSQSNETIRLPKIDSGKKLYIDSASAASNTDSEIDDDDKIIEKVKVVENKKIKLNLTLKKKDIKDNIIKNTILSLIEDNGICNECKIKLKIEIN